MICIRHRHRFAYVHIYKAGGTAMSELLLGYARLRERLARLPGGGSRAIDAVFTLESLAGDTGPLRSFLGLSEAEDAALPRRNQNSARGTRSALPASLRAELAQYLAPDIALHDAAVAAGGALLATPSRPVLVSGK